jgi:hypothetical protein
VALRVPVDGLEGGLALKPLVVAGGYPPGHRRQHPHRAQQPGGPPCSRIAGQQQQHPDDQQAEQGQGAVHGHQPFPGLLGADVAGQRPPQPPGPPVEDVGRPPPAGAALGGDQGADGVGGHGGDQHHSGEQGRQLDEDLFHRP